MPSYDILFYTNEPAHENVMTSGQMLVLICVNVKSSLITSNIGVFTDKGGDLPCFNISKHTRPVVKSSDETFVLFYIYVKSMG